MTDVPVTEEAPAVVSMPKVSIWPSVLQTVKDVFTFNASTTKKVNLILLLGWVGFALLVWGNSKLALLPTPGEVWATHDKTTGVMTGGFVKEWLAGSGDQMIKSLKLSLEAIAYATVIGLSLCYLSTISFFHWPVVAIGKLRSLSLAGLIMFFYFATGGGHALKVSVLTFTIVTFLVNDMLQKIDDIPQARFDYARTLGLNKFQVQLEVVIRGTLHDAFESVRANAAIAWMMLTGVETLSQAGGGIGVLIFSLNKGFNLPSLFAIQLMIFVVGIGQDQAIRLLKTLVCPYTVRKKA